MSKKEQSNFKQRFAGKIEKVDKLGGIEVMMATASKPIKEIDSLSASRSYKASEMPMSRQSNVNSVIS